MHHFIIKRQSKLTTWNWWATLNFRVNTAVKKSLETYYTIRKSNFTTWRQNVRYVCLHISLRRGKGSRFGNGFSKGGSVSSLVGQRSHHNVGAVAGCKDRRATSRLHEDDPLVVRSGPAAAAIAADDHNNDEENRAANHSSFASIVHFMPPSKGTWIDKCFYMKSIINDIFQGTFVRKYNGNEIEGSSLLRLNC